MSYLAPPDIFNHPYASDIGSARWDDHFVDQDIYRMGGYNWPSFYSLARNWHFAELYSFRSTQLFYHTGPDENPLTPQYNFVEEKHEYPHAEPNAHPDYAIANPLSNNSKFPGFPELIFSDFRHYIFPNPQNFAGTPYNVTDDQPIARISFGGIYASLDMISIWSPYSDATWIDFANSKAYNNSLEASAIWS